MKTNTAVAVECKDTRDNLIHDYFLLLEDINGYIDIKFVNPPIPDEPQHNNNNIFKKLIDVFNAISDSQPKRIGRFHELAQIRDNIRDTRIKNTISEMSRSQLEAIMYSLVIEDNDAVQLAINSIPAHDSDDKNAILVVFNDLTTDQILRMVNDLLRIVQADDYESYSNRIFSHNVR